MRFFITKKILVGIIVALCALIYFMFLSGCGRGSVQPEPPSVPGGPANALAGLAVWATWASGAGLLLCGVATFFLPNKLQILRIALGCIATMLTAGILHWISAHWAVLLGLCACVILLSGVAWAYINRRFLEKKSGVDLNRDGKIG
jgi:hypothetical protein